MAPVHSVETSTPSEYVLANATLLQHIVSFQDGLPGLMRSLKRDMRAHGGKEDDWAVAAVKRRKLRGLEMVDSLRKLPQYRGRYDLLNYSSAAVTACTVNDVASFQWIITCPTADHRLTRRQMKQFWYHAVAHFQPGDFRILEILRWLHDQFPTITIPDQVFDNAVCRGDSAIVDFWLANRPESVPKHSLSHALESRDSWALYLKLQLNSKIVPDADEWLTMVTSAVKQEDVTLIKLLHTHSATYPFSKPPVQAMEIAAASGHVEIVEELYEHHKETGKIITARALELAATNGHIHVLQFLATHSQFESVPEALDGAAANGHLQCVRFLHESGRFTATTSAMDTAATNGHFAVVQYLHTHRSEGCTAQALAGAAENDQDDITTWLLTNRSEVRSAAGLDELLLAGKIREWLMYRDEWMLRGDDAVDSPHHLGELLFQAGRRGKLAAMRFLCTSLNQSDQLHRAYEGAVEIGSVSWLFAIQALDTTPPSKRVKFSTIARAVALERDDYRFQVSENERLDALKWLVMQCSDKHEYNAMQDALQLLMALRDAKEGPFKHLDYSYRRRPYEQVDLVMALRRWGEHRRPRKQEMQVLRRKYTRGVYGFAMRGGAACDWVLERAVYKLLPRFMSWDDRQLGLHNEKNETRDDDPWRLGKWTWPSLAGVDASQFVVDDSVLTAAIAVGHLEIVQWYLDECDSAGQSDDHPFRLLEAAVQYGQPQVADWLLRGMPQCASQLSADYRLHVWPEFINPRVLDWLDHLEEHSDHAMLLSHVEPLAIARSLAHAGHVDLLDRFLTRHPQLRTMQQTTEILMSAGEGGHLQCVTYVCDVMETQETQWSEDGDVVHIQKTMATAASDGQLEIVAFLFRKFPSVSWHDAVLDAAAYTELRVLRFLFMNGYAQYAVHAAVCDEASTVVRRLAFFCRARGAESL